MPSGAWDEWIYHRLSFMDKAAFWVTRYHPGERFPEGKYPEPFY
ncbi:hypothetical protein [Escherichia coli]